MAALGYFALAQGGPGTTVIAPAAAGNKHKVLGLTLSLANDGTFRLTSNAAPMTGDIKVDGQLQPFVQPISNIPFSETATGAELRIVTTQSAQGFVVFATEP